MMNKIQKMHLKFPKLFLLFGFCHLLAAQPAAEPPMTERVYLSGTDKDNRVDWDFYCTEGARSGEWTTIPVPSCWDVEGFGTLAFGRKDERGYEIGKYRHRFVTPAAAEGNRVEIVFDGVMTDAAVRVNGQSAGPIHQGAFYRFSYDITDMLKPVGQENLLEVDVAKESANEGVNAAERYRRADYWLFGGIFRPVYLEIAPPTHVEHVAIDAGHEGGFTAEATVSGTVGDETVRVRIEDREGNTVATFPPVAVDAAGLARIEGSAVNIDPWSHEYPNLYHAIFEIERDGEVVHGHKERFGFRTVEMVSGTGLVLNGEPVVIKGANRHEIWPDTGRTVSREVAEMDARMMKEMNMNAVRTSHYPPDEVFLEVADEVGLLVMLELAGWHGRYGIEDGTPLVKSMVLRDRNKPSVVFWANGNEGGSNLEISPVFHEFDPQDRPVFIPSPFRETANEFRDWDQSVMRLWRSGHYPSYGQFPDSTEPYTEMLHGLYDGGGGAGLEAYWEKLREQGGSGGYLWALVDEGVLDPATGEINTAGNNAPDGVIGPYREKEGSYYTVRRVWNPFRVEAFEPGEPASTLAVTNEFDFTNLNQCEVIWKVVDYPDGPTEAGYAVADQGQLTGPDVAPGETGELSLPLPANWTEHDALVLVLNDHNGKLLDEIVMPIHRQATYRERMFSSLPAPAGLESSMVDEEVRVVAGSVAYRFDAVTGELLATEVQGTDIGLGNGPRAVGFDPGSLRQAEFRRTDGSAVILGGSEDGSFSFEWTISRQGELRLDWTLDKPGEYELLGVTFDLPETGVEGMDWLGYGPFRVWSNRMSGGDFKVHQKAYNDGITGVNWIYPEFKGYHRGIAWGRLSWPQGNLWFGTDDPGLLVQIFEPSWPDSPRNAKTDFPDGGLSFLHRIPGIGNKLKKSEHHGPTGSAKLFPDTVSGSAWLRAVSLGASAPSAASHGYDVVVVGATPAGVAAAENAARQGLSTALFAEKRHIGGVPAGGLTNTDFQSFEGLGGSWRDFMDRVLAYYAETYGPESQQVEDCKAGAWFEPGVARRVFSDMLADSGVTVFPEHPLESASTTVNEAGRRQLTGATFKNLAAGTSRTVHAKVFIDATYEGDLMALAGADYRIGDVQSYNFRVCMSQFPENQIPFAEVRPEAYGKMDFSGFRQYLLDNPNVGLEKEVKIRDGVNGKKDFNTKAFTAEYHFSIDGNGWTEGTHEYRQAMFELATAVAQGFFYFLATDPALEGHRIQEETRRWGYAADEYPETGHWSPELYVRQGRRLVGVYEATGWDRGQPENSVRSRPHRDSIAIGDYQSVAHREFTHYGLSPQDFLAPGAEAVRDWPERESTGTPETRNALDLPDLPSSTAEVNRKTLPFEVPYGSIVPVSLDGLLVPVALSCDDRMYNAIRMEPTWTALGQAAGQAAALALEEGVPLRDVDTDRLRRNLHRVGAMTFYASDVDRDSPYFEAVQYFGNLGYFHATELIATPGRPPAPVDLRNTQWSRALPYHDVLKAPSSESPLKQGSAVLEREVEDFWRQRTLSVFGPDALEGFKLTSDGELTRGDYLNALLEHLR